MRKYLIAWIMVHIGMIHIQGERTFIIVFFFRMLTIYVLFRLVVEKKEKNETKQFRWFLSERSKSD